MTRKEMNAVKAKSWLDLIDANQTWVDAINKSAKNATVRKGRLVSRDELAYMCSRTEDRSLDNVSLTEENTYDAICRLLNEEGTLLGVLNFASYFNPGGGFLKGAGAQEESLCHVSGLYPILSMQKVYSTRRLNKEVPPTYGDELIYCNNVPFTSAEGHVTMPYLVDVISVAAPNCNRVPITAAEYILDALRKRIEAIVVMPFINGCNSLVLGAWGCGVFKNDPETVARIFKGTILKYGSAYKSIVFALPNNAIRKVFDKVFNSED